MVLAVLDQAVVTVTDTGAAAVLAVRRGQMRHHRVSPVLTEQAEITEAVRNLVQPVAAAQSVLFGALAVLVARHHSHQPMLALNFWR